MGTIFSVDEQNVGGWVLKTYRHNNEISGYEITGTMSDGRPFCMPFPPDARPLVEYLMSVAPSAPKASNHD